MASARKTKISISLDADVLDAVDRRAAKQRTTRSAVMEQWLRGAARQAELQRLEEETAAYYDALTPAEKAEDAALAEASSRAFQDLTIDDAPPRTRKRRSRRG
ncbi:MAG TPA: ribbon-helix-helix protein, CopG family [Polyangia bacterium]|jgi:metal-responsive CopG/Arc/MetJ family transcriptional regulator